MDSSERGRFVRRNSFRFGQVARTDMARLLDDEDDGDDMGLLETELLRIDRSTRECSHTTSHPKVSIAPDVATEQAARRGSFCLSSWATTAESEEDQTKRSVFRRGSFRLNRRTSLDAGSLLGGDLATYEHEEAAVTETSKELEAVPPKSRRMSLDMSSFLDAQVSSPVAAMLETKTSSTLGIQTQSRSTECSTSNGTDLNESSSPRGKANSRDVPPSKEHGTCRARARQLRRTKSHSVAHAPRPDREVRRTKSYDIGADGCQSPGHEAKENPDQESMSTKLRPKRREPLRRSASSSEPATRPIKSKECECSSPRRRTCASRVTRHSSAESRQSSPRESERASAKTRETACLQSEMSSKSAESFEATRKSSPQSNGHRSKPKSSRKSDQVGMSKLPESASSSSSNSAGKSRSASSSRSVCRRSVSRSCSRSRSSRGEHAGRRDGSGETDDCLRGSILADKRKKSRPQASAGYLPTAFATRQDSDSDGDDRSICYDDASECSSSIQLDILNPALVDHYVSAAVSLVGHGQTRDFVGADISAVPDDEDDDLTDDERINDEVGQIADELKRIDAWKAPTARGPLPFNSVLDHFGFRRRTEGSPAC